jgi:type VI protein secretion system component VasF
MILFYMIGRTESKTIFQLALGFSGGLLSPTEAKSQLIQWRSRSYATALNAEYGSQSGALSRRSGWAEPGYGGAGSHR